MGSFMPEGSLGWFDSALRPDFGDICLVEVPRPDGEAIFYVKVIEKVAGKLWGLSEDAPLPIMKGMRIIGPLVAAMTSPAPMSVKSNAHDPELYAALLRHAAPMLAHVMRHGFDRETRH
jgi:hypothetical protein